MHFCMTCWRNNLKAVPPTTSPMSSWLFQLYTFIGNLRLQSGVSPMRAAGSDGGSEMQKTVLLCFQTSPWGKKAPAAAATASNSTIIHVILFKNILNIVHQSVARGSHHHGDVPRTWNNSVHKVYIFYLLQHFPTLLNVGVKHCTFFLTLEKAF